MKKVLLAVTVLVSITTYFSCSKGTQGGVIYKADSLIGSVNGGPWEGRCMASKTFDNKTEYLTITAFGESPNQYIVLYFPFSEDMPIVVNFDLWPNIPNALYIAAYGTAIDTVRALYGSITMIDRGARLSGTFSFTAHDSTKVVGSFNCVAP